jgi:hypothetical protein
VLQIFGDFEEARYNGGTVEIANSNQCRAVLRCLCEAGRIGPENAVTKHELYEYLRSRNLARHVEEGKWSPAQEFRALLSPLYGAVGRRNGKYWLKPDPKG